MSVTLPDSALTTLALAREELGITDTSEDARLARLIRRASDVIGRLRRHGIYRQTITEKLKGYGGDTLVLALRPLVSVDGLVIDGTTEDHTEVEILDANAGVIRLSTGWPWTARRSPGVAQDRMGGTEEAVIAVTYTGGWATPQQVEDDATIDEPHLPDQIADGALDTVVSLYRRAGRDPLIASEAIASASASYRGVNTAIGQGMGGIIPDHIWRDLQWLREIRI